MKKDDPTYIPYIEEKIQDHPELRQKYVVHTYQELRPGDIIQCTYLRGLYKIESIGNKDQITIRSVCKPHSTYSVSSKFLKLCNSDSKTLKVLFGS
jgi:hypothetical protein